MDERRQLMPPERRHESSPARALADQREQVKRYVTEIAEAADAAEQEIAASVNRLLEDLTADHAAQQEKHDSASSARWNDKLRQLEQRERDLNAREDAFRRLEAETTDSGKRFEEDRRRLEADAEETKRRQTRFEELRRRLETQEEELEARDRQTKTQRRRIAAELREERDAGQREQRRATDELQRRATEIDRREEAVQRRAEELDRRAAESPSAPASDEGLREEVFALQEALAERNAALTELTDRCDDLRQRLNDYKAKLAETEARLDEGGDRNSDEVDEWRRRFEAADEELRELKRRGSGTATSHDAGGSDWESQKRRMMAALESDFATDDPDAHADKLTIEGTLRITDGVVAEREQEIADLRRQLADRNDGDGRAAGEIAASQDEYIAERRTQIEQLRTEWEHKLRTAEIEMSLERAALARARAEYEERHAEFERQQARAPQEPIVVKKDGDAAKSGGGRWLARLGLREKDGG